MPTATTIRRDSVDYVVVYRDGKVVTIPTNPNEHPPAQEHHFGDALESFLASYGITKEWSVALKDNGHREPECKHRGIEASQQLKVSCSCSATGEKIETVHQCDIESIRRCLPHFHPNNKDRKSWAERKPESDIYQLCDACPHFKAKG
jgi:hypothetical protein